MWNVFKIGYDVSEWCFEVICLKIWVNNGVVNFGFLMRIKSKKDIVLFRIIFCNCGVFGILVVLLC